MIGFSDRIKSLRSIFGYVSDRIESGGLDLPDKTDREEILLRLLIAAKHL